MSTKKPAISMYADQMHEIKKRTEVIDFFLLHGGHALYKPTTTEAICLQFRKILELIAFGSLIANKAQYSAVHTKFESHWNAELLLKDLARVNSRFYPEPVEERPTNEPGVKSELAPVTDGFLTQADFVHIYKKCGGMLHAVNPYGSKTSYHYFEKSFTEWRAKLIKLLNTHQIHLVGQENFWLIHMKEDADDEVHYYEFAPVLKQ